MILPLTGVAAENCIDPPLKTLTQILRKFRPLLAVLAASSLLAFSGCSTLAKLRGPKTAITTAPAGAELRVDGSKAGAAPVQVRLSGSKAHLVVAKADAGAAGAVLLPAFKEQPARLFLIGDGLSEASGYTPGSISLELKPAAADAYAALTASVAASDQLLAAGKLTKAEHATLNKKIISYYTK